MFLSTDVILLTQETLLFNSLKLTDW